MKFYKYFLFAGLAIAALGCEDDQKEKAIVAGDAVQIDTAPGACPYLTKNQNGNIVMSWAKAINDSDFVFCYAVFNQERGCFDKTVTVPGTGNIQPHAENLPKIIFKPSGETIVLWGAANPNPHNKYSGLVYYSHSLDDGKTWSAPKSLVSDTAGYDQRYYDVALLANGEAAVIWLDNRKKTAKEGSALYYAHTSGNNGFGSERIIGEGCCQCCRTDLFVDEHANIHVLYRGIIKDSIRDMLHTVSVDGGKHFSSPQLISNDNWVIKGCPHTGPSMTENKDGIHFAWFTGGANKGCFYSQSVDNGKSFVHHERISFTGSHPQITSFPDGRLAAVWDEPVPINNKYYRRIGMQLRTADGREGVKQFLTADTVTASYPVLIPAGNKKAMVACSIKKGGKEFVQYQLINLQVLPE
jgi:hypothetical protein